MIKQTTSSLLCITLNHQKFSPQAELDRQENARAEAERQRMRRLMREGIISFEQLQEATKGSSKKSQTNPDDKNRQKKKRVRDVK